MRIWWWGRVPRRGHATWHAHLARRGSISTSRLFPRPDCRPHRQPLRRSHSYYAHFRPEGIDDEPARRGSDEPELEDDWALYDEPELTLEEQEARFYKTELGHIYSNIRQPCAVCGGPHPISRCILVFEDSLETVKDTPLLRERRRFEFQKRMATDQEFHDAVTYLRNKFNQRSALGFLSPLPQSATRDAPPLAKEYLSKFDNSARYVRGATTRVGDPRAFKGEKETSFYTGYYPTTDDDGRPFLIVFTQSAHLDENMPFEIKLIRTAVAQYNRGTKSIFHQAPEDDTRPIGIVVMSRRWHSSHSMISRGAPSLGLQIASEYNWQRGQLRFGIHVGTREKTLDGVDVYWSSGMMMELDHGGSAPPHVLVTSADTKFDMDASQSNRIHSLGMALLRDVREPVERFSGIGDTHNYYPRFCRWRTMLLPRAAALYGPDSPQYKAIEARARYRPGNNLQEENLSTFGLAALPSWGHIMSRIALHDKPYEDQVIWRSIFSQERDGGGAD